MATQDAPATPAAPTPEATAAPAAPESAGANSLAAAIALMESAQQETETPADQAPASAPASTAPATDPSTSEPPPSDALQRILAKERELLELKQSLEQRQRQADPMEQLRQRAKDDPFAVMDQIGVDWPTLFGEPQQPDPMKDVTSEVATLKRQLAEQQEQFQRFYGRQQAEERARHVQSEVEKLGADKAPIMAHLSKQNPIAMGDMVADRIRARQQLGVETSVPEIVNELEQQQRQALLDGVKTLASLPGMRTLVLQMLGVPDAPQAKAAAGTRTLSNALGAERPASEHRELTNEERFQEAVRLVRASTAED